MLKTAGTEAVCVDAGLVEDGAFGVGGEGEGGWREGHCDGLCRRHDDGEIERTASSAGDREVGCVWVVVKKKRALLKKSKKQCQMAGRLVNDLKEVCVRSSEDL